VAYSTPLKLVGMWLTLSRFQVGQATAHPGASPATPRVSLAQGWSLGAHVSIPPSTTGKSLQKPTDLLAGIL
jgi:hypothetical protein